MSSFHVSLHSQPREVDASNGQPTIQGRPVSASDLTVPLSVTFEETASRLEDLPRMFFEPDGSFICVTDDAGDRQQVDGMLHDRGDALMTVELKGTADWTLVESLLACLDWPNQELLVQDMQKGSISTVFAFRDKLYRGES